MEEKKYTMGDLVKLMFKKCLVNPEEIGQVNSEIIDVITYLHKINQFSTVIYKQTLEFVELLCVEKDDLESTNLDIIDEINLIINLKINQKHQDDISKLNKILAVLIEYQLMIENN